MSASERPCGLAIMSGGARLLRASRLRTSVSARARLRTTSAADTDDEGGFALRSCSSQTADSGSLDSGVLHSAAIHLEACNGASKNANDGASKNANDGAGDNANATHAAISRKKSTPTPRKLAKKLGGPPIITAVDATEHLVCALARQGLHCMPRQLYGLHNSLVLLRIL